MQSVASAGQVAGRIHNGGSSLQPCQEVCVLCSQGSCASAAAVLCAQAGYGGTDQRKVPGDVWGARRQRSRHLPGIEIPNRHPITVPSEATSVHHVSGAAPLLSKAQQLPVQSAGATVVHVQVIYLTGWAPHSSQQRAARRGSASASFQVREHARGAAATEASLCLCRVSKAGGTWVLPGLQLAKACTRGSGDACRCETSALSATAYAFGGACAGP
jgi:hypothetical protein